MITRILGTAPLAVALCASFGFAIPAFAGDDTQAPPQGEHHGHEGKGDDKGEGKGEGRHHEEMMAKFDTNHDGKLDETERAAMRTAMAARLKEKHPELFAKLDTNHDGELSKEEFEAGKKMLQERRREHAGKGEGKAEGKGEGKGEDKPLPDAPQQ